MATQVFDPIAVTGWERDFIQQLIIDSIWEPLSNRSVETRSVPNADNDLTPTKVIHHVGSTFKKGVTYVTIPYVDKLSKEGVGGSEVLQGTEESPVMQFSQVFYNLRRKATSFKDQSVDGDMTDAYPLVRQQVPLMREYYMQLHDFDYHRALLLSGDQYLTLPRFWKGPTQTTPPVKDSPPNNILYAGGITLITWNTNPETYMDAIVTALNDAFTDATTKMTKAVLTRMVEWCHNNLKPIEGEKFSYVILLSSIQTKQLTSDAVATGWLDTFTNAGSRGDNNKAITGALGVYRDCLVLENKRSPILDCTTTGYTGTWQDRFQFVQPWYVRGPHTSGIKKGDNRIRVVKGVAGADAGTCEIAFLLGAGALGRVKIEDLKFRSDNWDYKFANGFSGYEKCGTVRLDIFQPTFFSAGVSSVKPQNQSSGIYITPTDAEIQ